MTTACATAPSTLRLRTHPDPILRERCHEVGEITPHVRECIARMIEIAKHDGFVRAGGLAANQVGWLARVIIIDLRGKWNGRERVLINPVIEYASEDTAWDIERCLSLPRVSMHVCRPKRIRVRALDLDGAVVRFKAKGLEARIIQHEIDHLDGVLIDTRAENQSVERFQWSEEIST